MDRKLKIIFALGIAVILLLIALAAAISYKLAVQDNHSIQVKLANVEKTQHELISKINNIDIKQPRDGYTPRKGVDYFDGTNGRDGKNSVSKETTVIRERAVHGESAYDIALRHGFKGSEQEWIDSLQPRLSPLLEIRISPLTGDLETKLSTDDFWGVLIPCNKLQVGCK